MPIDGKEQVILGDLSILAEGAPVEVAQATERDQGRQRDSGRWASPGRGAPPSGLTAASH